LFPGLTRKGGETESKFIDEDPPRAYSDYPFDLDQEIRGAITAAEELAPEDKHGTLYLWSGGAGPVRGAVARPPRLRPRNLTGGDSRFAVDYPSISYLPPISRPAGAERQIYAGSANDYIYTTDGGGREHGFLHLEATVNATETPRRLKPINVYYHMFAGEPPAPPPPAPPPPPHPRPTPGGAAPRPPPSSPRRGRPPPPAHGDVPPTGSAVKMC